jgi:hypothetical protein
MNRADLLSALAQIQNHPMYEHQDIMTFTALMNDDEVRLHIERNMAGIGRWSETVHRRKRR